MTESDAGFPWQRAVRAAATGFKVTDILKAAVSLLFPALVAQVNLRSRNLIPKLAFWPVILGACFAVTLVFLY